MCGCTSSVLGIRVSGCGIRGGGRPGRLARHRCQPGSRNPARCEFHHQPAQESIAVIPFHAVLVARGDSPAVFGWRPLDALATPRACRRPLPPQGTALGVSRNGVTSCRSPPSSRRARVVRGVDLEDRCDAGLSPPAARAPASGFRTVHGGVPARVGEPTANTGVVDCPVRLGIGLAFLDTPQRRVLYNARFLGPQVESSATTNPAASELSG